MICVIDLHRDEWTSGGQIYVQVSVFGWMQEHFPNLGTGKVPSSGVELIPMDWRWDRHTSMLTSSRRQCALVL